jgi:hypothetical protein
MIDAAQYGMLVTMKAGLNLAERDHSHSFEAFNIVALSSKQQLMSGLEV